ncbi:MAG: outer membrane beta-barrel protein [Oxalobacteraceae bacterium]
MKKFFIAAVMSAVSATVMAADVADSYVAASIGQGKYSTAGESDTQMGFGLAFGQSLSEYAGYELGYANPGRAFGGTTHSYYLAGVARYPVADAVTVYGKLGPTLNHVSGDDSATRVRLLLGAGLGYQFDKNWAATLEYTHFGDTFDTTSSLWSVGVRYHFQ